MASIYITVINEELLITKHMSTQKKHITAYASCVLAHGEQRHDLSHVLKDKKFL